MKRTSSAQKGQALLLTTLSLTVLIGMLGLAVDLGWGRFQHRIAQAAADSGAISAAAKALDTMGQNDAPNCSVNVSCQSATACPASGSLNTACLYAARNGFSSGGAAGRQTLLVAAGTGSAPANVPAVSDGIYWTQVTAGQSSPQSFSGVLGNTMLNVGVRATAAVVNSRCANRCFY